MCVADLNRSFSPEGAPALFDDATPSDGGVIPMNQSAGAYWEERALELIVSRYTIITRNYSSRFGKIDLIASDNDRPAVMELQHRKRRHFGSAMASAFLARK
jgi:hypothetical protein